MSDNCYLSEALYVGLCDYIGTPTEVTARREVMDMKEEIMEPLEKHICCRKMETGSHREGFRFQSSDVDTMLWYTNYEVITNLKRKKRKSHKAQSSDSDPSKHSRILMEDTDTPGFVRLRHLKSPRKEDYDLEPYVVSFNGRDYISNVKWRQIILTLMVKNNSFNHAKIHGPCANGFIGDIEHDYAACFHCSYWSRFPSDLKKIPNFKGVFDDISRNGCHIVPVGSKRAGVENELEWRLSFSQAEQKLVYSMNHTQFLCYGLLKIFLKEVVNRDKEEPFLCSYFLKTTMFWMMKKIGYTDWYPRNLLNCFMACLAFLIDKVGRGILPNFFIRKNNMFAAKLTTAKGKCARECLFQELKRYHNMGLTCLLQSSTLKKLICNNLSGIYPIIYKKDHIIDKSAADTDICLKEEIYRLSLGENVRENYFILRFTILLNEPLTEYKTLTLQKCTADVLVHTAFLYLNTSTVSTNKKVYRSDRLIGNLLKLAGRVGDASCLLYLALYYYRTCRYREALHVTALVKSRLTQPYIMFSAVDRERYNESVGGWSLSKRMQKAWADLVCLKKDIYYIQELDLEQKLSKENSQPALLISPYVVTDMLSVLCNYRLGNRHQCLQSMTDLQTLMLKDVHLRTIDISWQILGICQHVVGDLNGAFQSYQKSLRQEPFNKIQNASKYRIAFTLNQLFRN
ncbi:uncharacterized protein LOC128181199 [Crassostrea angulata]|uniref:uncharacterized protein LOC128181199 n=1 Tax=Magallana angulata TaxID=2784310 RepID=UPI0022B2092B|nr:uncharacterized protein LOC128181199 [Crassostrea angulata]